MRKRWLGVLVSIVMAVGCLSGCSGDGKAVDKEIAEDGGKSGNENGTNGEKIKVKFAHFFEEGHAFYEITNEAIERFNKENKEAEIIADVMAPDPYLTNINALGTSDGLPEICMINGSMMKAFSDTGVIIPLTDLVKEYEIDKNMKEGVFSECTNYDDNNIYSIPIASGIYGFILYNTEIFDEVGIKEFPKTLDEFKVASEKIKEAGYIPMALGDKALWPADSLCFSAFVNNFVGNEWYDSIRIRDGKAKFTDSCFIDALKAFKELAEEGIFNEDFSSIDNDERQALYTNGKAAMISAGDWECTNINDNNPEIGKVTKAAPWPAPKNSKATESIEQSSAWGIALGANITEEQKKVALHFIKDYILTEDYGRTMIEVKNNFPSWKCNYDASKLTVPAASMVEAADKGTPCLNWDATLDPTVKEVYQRGLQELLMDSITPEQLAKDMQQEYEMVE